MENIKDAVAKAAAETTEEPKVEEKKLTPAQKGAATRAKKKAEKEAATPPVEKPVVSKSEERRQAILKGDDVVPVKKEEVKFIKNNLGEDVPVADYFYKGMLSSGFKGTCGSPVSREDLLTVFHKVFKPEDNILFYKQDDKEVYIVIIPIRFSEEIGENHDSLDGDFQKHAISFLSEGQVNPDTLRQKLERIVKFVKYSDR